MFLKEIEEKLMKKMQSAFSSTKDRKMAIHLTAVAGAAIVAVLPIGTDAYALRAAEIIMVICIAGSYGEKLTKSAAKGLLLSSFAQLAGEAAAFAALEAAETSKIATVLTGFGPAAAYAIKSGIAVGLIETVGHLVLASYEKPKGIAAAACKATEAVGFAADVSRVVSLAADAANTAGAAGFDAGQSTSLTEKKGNAIPFCGSIYTEADLADAAEKVDRAWRKVQQYTEYLQSDIRNGRNTTTNEINLKYAQRAYESALREFERIKNAIKH